MSMREIIPVINDYGNVILDAERQVVQSHVLLHMTSRVSIFKGNCDSLFQKRSLTKSLYPDYWDVSVAETVKINETYAQAAIRGLKEELGIVVINSGDLNLKGTIKYISPNLKTHCRCYSLFYDGPLVVNSNEISGLKWLGYTNFDKYERFLKGEQIHPICRLFLDRFGR